MLNQGDTLGAYDIHSVIGQGGFGIVYQGVHRELGATVAIKEFFPAEICVRHHQLVQPSKGEFHHPFEENLDRFIKEAKQLEFFRGNPNIVTCRDLFRANGTAYIVMDFIDGLSLSLLFQHRETKGAPFTEQDLMQVIGPLVNGLQTVHASDVFHRDIKPSNILIQRKDDSPVLIDFGAAKHEITRHTKSFAPYSDGYAAIEQIGEGDIGPWTDIYGIGAVMWRMVAGGNPPFSPPNPLASTHRAYKLMQGHEDPLPSAKQIGSGRFSDQLLCVIDDCLIVTPDQRIQDCKELQERLISLTESNSSLGVIHSLRQPSHLSPDQATPIDASPHDQSNEALDPKLNRWRVLNIFLAIIGGFLILVSALGVWGIWYDHGINYGDDDDLALSIGTTLFFALPLCTLGLFLFSYGLPATRRRWYQPRNKIHPLQQSEPLHNSHRFRKRTLRTIYFLLSLLGIYVMSLGFGQIIGYIAFSVAPPNSLTFGLMISVILFSLIPFILGFFIFWGASKGLTKSRVDALQSDGEVP